jgi:hypothetical protein
MDIETVRDGGLDLVEELAELCGTVTGIAFADDLARRNDVAASSARTA